MVLFIHEFDQTFPLHQDLPFQDLATIQHNFQPNLYKNLFAIWKKPNHFAFKGIPIFKHMTHAKHQFIFSLHFDFTT